LCFYTAAGAGWSLCGEVSTARLRARTAGFAAGAAVVVGIPLGYGTPYMISANSLNWGLKTCFFFAGLSFFLVVATWFIIPETAKRSPAELDEMFEAKVKPWRFRKYVTEVQRSRKPELSTRGGAEQN
jgi:SP family general alpha glucoside:H+ symporter-like MFS transporter